MYGHVDDNLYVNLFIPGTAVVRTDRGAVTVKQQTRYPCDGAVKIAVNPSQAAEFTINVRIPGWARYQAAPGDLYVEVGLEEGFSAGILEWRVVVE